MLPENIALDSIIKIGEILGYQNVRFVGGTVREVLLGRKPKDIDLATTLLPQEVVGKLEAKGYKTFDTGIKYGTVSISLNKHLLVEITTLRKDVNQDGRHADVVFTRSFEEDSQRRDFTINAMYMDFEGNLYDYHNGKDDLDNKRLRFVGDADARIREDYLRVLRFFRFYSYYTEMTFKPDIKAAIVTNLDGLRSLSGERVAKELLLMLAGINSLEAIKLAHEFGVLKTIFDPISVLKPIAFCQYPLVNLLLLLKDATEFQRLNELFKLSRAQMNILKVLVTTPKLRERRDHFSFLYSFDKELYEMKCAYLGIEALPIERKNLPIASREIAVKLGIEGQKLGLAIKYAEQIWVEGEFTIDASSIMQSLQAQQF